MQNLTDAADLKRISVKYCHCRHRSSAIGTRNSNDYVQMHVPTFCLLPIKTRTKNCKFMTFIQTAYICPRFWSVLPVRLRDHKFIEPVYRDALDMETLG